MKGYFSKLVSICAQKKNRLFRPVFLWFLYFQDLIYWFGLRNYCFRGRLSQILDLSIKTLDHQKYL